MLFTSIACLALAGQVSVFEAHLQDSLHETVRLTTGPDDPLLEGHGRCKTIQYTANFEGTLHVWTRSGPDPLLRVLGAGGELLGESDYSSGGRTPCVRIEVEAGDDLVLAVASAEAGRTGTFELHVVASPETLAARLAAVEARSALEMASTLEQEGDRESARRLCSATLEELGSVDGAEHSEAVADVLHLLGERAESLGDLQTSHSAWSRARSHRERTLPDDHHQLFTARINLARTMAQLGDLEGARARFERIIEGLERSLPDDHPDLLRARSKLAVTMMDAGDLRGARALGERVVAGMERTLPDDHHELLLARRNLALTMKQQGELEAARAIEERLVEVREQTLPEDHPDLIAARMNLATTMLQMGEVQGARAALESVVEAWKRILPEDHPNLSRARLNLAVTLRAMGDLAEARAAFERALAGFERTLPEDHPDLLRAHTALAATVHEMGDLAGARAGFEHVLEARERTLPEDHPELLSARMNLAIAMSTMGDLPGARALEERVVEAWEQVLPEDHPHLLLAQQNLAATMAKMGDLHAARALGERVLAISERTLPGDHPDLLQARMSLAVTMYRQSDLESARSAFESVIAARERTLPPDHRDLLAARLGLAATLYEMGDLESALELDERVVAARERTLPGDHPDLLAARSSLSVTAYVMGDLPAARALLPELCAGMRRRVLGSLALAPREVREAIGAERSRLELALLVSQAAGSAAQKDLFVLVETMRSAASEAPRALRASSLDPELAPFLAKASAVRSALNDLVGGAAQVELDAEELSAELTRLSLERDRLERKVSLRLTDRGAFGLAIESEELARALEPGAAAVGLLRYATWVPDDSGGETLEAGEDHLLAHVLHRDGTLQRVELGPAAQIETLVEAWRTALGEPVSGRGLGLEAGESATDRELRAGEELRRRALDPVLRAVEGEISKLHICSDDLLHLVPFDALPDDDMRVGDRLRIVNEVSFARLIKDEPPLPGPPSLLALGAVDFEHSPETGDLPALAAGSAPIEASHRGGAEGADFSPLPGTKEEVEALGTLFRERFSIDPCVLQGERANKPELSRAVAGKRYVHLATHGWFAPESVRSTLDRVPGNRDGLATMGVEERIAGFAPMTLCGLALAGANRGRDSLGRVPGILTAEESCGLDLSACELAVLSACETNVGIRRAGQGIQSLQAALYAAGARTSVTSLWKVDDFWTRELMTEFYRLIWTEERPKAEALWEAKMRIRERGAGLVDWAGWVLTGDPE